MNKMLMTVGCLAASAATAQNYRPAQLAPSPYADSEIVTNVPCAFDLNSLKSCQHSIEFVATESNNVDVAYGHDANGDGVLSNGEVGFEYGWDCGAAFARGLGGEATPEVEGPDSNGVRRITVFVAVKAHKANPRWLYDRSWDTMRVTKRGVDDPQERVSFRTKQSGMMVIVR